MKSIRKSHKRTGKIKLIEKVWNKNKKIWWFNQLKKDYELHHVLGRIGIFKCCPVFFVAISKKDHRNIKSLKKLKKIYKEKAKQAQNNFVKRLGCKNKNLFIECDYCAMPEVKLEKTR